MIIHRCLDCHLQPVGRALPFSAWAGPRCLVRDSSNHFRQAGEDTHDQRGLQNAHADHPADQLGLGFGNSPVGFGKVFFQFRPQQFNVLLRGKISSPGFQHGGQRGRLRLGLLFFDAGFSQRLDVARVSKVIVLTGLLLLLRARPAPRGRVPASPGRGAVPAMRRFLYRSITPSLQRRR